MAGPQPLSSDIVINVDKFNPASVSDEAANFNGILKKISSKGPRWWEVGAATYRQMWEKGETTLPKPTLLPEAKNSSVPSRDEGRDIPIRIYTPDNGQPSRGILLHFHGGGFVLGTETYSDPFLKLSANEAQLISISVGYRLAPEDPYPAGIQDCIDAAEYLVDHGERLFGAPLMFIAGESAGGCLTALTAFHLLRSRPEHQLRGLVMRFAVFDVGLRLPTMSAASDTAVINLEMMQQFHSAYAPGLEPEALRHPSISPLYEDMQGLAQAAPNKKLPSALFICGTEDPLLDENILMSMKWMMTGSEAIAKFYPGGAHGFTSFPIKIAAEAQATIVQFIKEKLA